MVIDHLGARPRPAAVGAQLDRRTLARQLSSRRVFDRCHLCDLRSALARRRHSRPLEVERNTARRCVADPMDRPTNPGDAPVNYEPTFELSDGTSIKVSPERLDLDKRLAKAADGAENDPRQRIGARPA